MIEPSRMLTARRQETPFRGDPRGGDSMNGEDSRWQRNPNGSLAGPSGCASTLSHPMSTQPQLHDPQAPLAEMPSADVRQTLREFVDGQQIATVFCVRERELRQKKN